MACGCDQPCNPCSPCEAVSASNETLPSALENFVIHFFGTVTKTVVNGKVVWTLPCDLATGLPGNTRLAGEGLACYFLRLFQNGIVGLTGAQGVKGDSGTNGKDGFTTVAQNFATPNPATCPTIQIQVSDGSVVIENSLVFIETAGWFEVTAVTGNTVAIKCKEILSNAAATVVAGSLVMHTGPAGPQGIKGPKGDKGDTGNTGAQGPAGTNGTNGAAALTTTTANYIQPAVGSTVVISVADSTMFEVGAQAYVVGGGYYDIVATAAGSITARNLTEHPPNVSSGSTITSGKTVVVSGVGPLASSSTIVGAGSDYALTDTYAAVDFGTTDIHLVLPMAGTYVLTANLQFQAGAPFSPSVWCIFHNLTDAADVGGTERRISFTADNQWETIVLTTTISVNAPKTIQIRAKRSTGAFAASAISTMSNAFFLKVNRV